MVIVVLVTDCGCSDGRCEAFVPAEHNAQSKGGNSYGTYILPDKEIQFQSGDKNQNKNVPGVIIIAGSGPTDRNGNSTVSNTYGNVNTYKWIADLLAKNGYASLRYDKFGSGKTGLGPYTPSDIAGLTFNIFLQEANNALKYLGNQPGG